MQYVRAIFLAFCAFMLGIADTELEALRAIGGIIIALACIFYNQPAEGGR